MSDCQYNAIEVMIDYIFGLDDVVAFLKHVVSLTFSYIDGHINQDKSLLEAFHLFTFFPVVNRVLILLPPADQ